jgi:PhzF family phenazine biosynthesis protein
MKLRIYQVDAFTAKMFRGNPAAICPLEEWLPDEVMQNIACENNLSETAFFVPDNKNTGQYHLRWFTPKFEIDLCGHATLATAHVLFNHLDIVQDVISFDTKSGLLRVKRDNGFLKMDFPAWHSKSIDPPKELTLGLGKEPTEVFQSRDIMAVFDNEETITKLSPDFHMLSALDVVGIIATAPGNNVDFVSRFFAPNAGVNEDPVTGSAHSTLVPYWANRLGKTNFHAQQLSERGGDLYCDFEDERVLIKGKAVTFMEGWITLPPDL